MHVEFTARGPGCDAAWRDHLGRTSDRYGDARSDERPATPLRDDGPSLGGTC